MPAREGTLRVLRAARAAGARRVVLTSSFAAIGYSPKASADKHGAEYTEEDWTDPDTPGLPPYPKFKAVAERAAWDFMRAEGGATELVVVNPTFILGPTLTSELRSSLQLVKGMLDGTLTTVRRQRFGVADVRDVAGLHIRAMAAPGAAGRRFLCLCDGPTISFPDLAEILRRRLGPLGARVQVQEEAGQDPPPLVIHNERARTELGFRPRPLETVIVESAASLRDLGLLAHWLTRPRGTRRRRRSGRGCGDSASGGPSGSSRSRTRGRRRGRRSPASRPRRSARTWPARGRWDVRAG